MSSSNVGETLKNFRLEISSLQKEQTSLSKRLEDVLKTFQERQDAKDDRINLMTEVSRSIQIQNDTLQKQLSSRWSFLTGMVTLVALAFVLNFGYEIYRISEVMNAKEFLQVGSKNLSENAVKYSDILNDLSYADTLISEGHRELLRNAYSDAALLAASAIDRLTKALKTTGFTNLNSLSSMTYDEPNCLLASTGPQTLITQALREIIENDRIKNNSAKLAESSDLMDALSPRRLRPVVVESLFSAYDLRANARFFSGDIAPLRNDGVLMIVLEPSHWAGYHWVGIASTRAKNTKLAVACFEQSVSRKSDGNKDDINLAEHFFVNGEYPKSLIYSEAYLKSVNYRFVSPVEIVANFYHSLAQYIVGKNLRSPAEFREALKKLGQSGADVKLEGTFDPIDLNSYLAGKTFVMLSAEQQHVVSDTAACLQALQKC